MSAATIQASLAAVMADVDHVAKDGKNQAQGYAFRGIDAVLNAVGPAFRKHGVVALPHVEHSEHEVVEVGKNRTPMRQATVTVRYVFHGPAGDTLDCVVVAEAMDSGDKATSKAMSVAQRTALIQVLALPTSEPDPDESTYERSNSERATQPRVEPPAIPGTTTAKHLQEARQALEGHVLDAPDGHIGTGELLSRLKALDPMQRGKVKARLEAAGLPSSSLPPTLPVATIDEIVLVIADESLPQ